MGMHRLPVPGFFDLQVNGFQGVDFSDPQLDFESCFAACRELLAAGIAGFVPTMITSSRETYARNLPLLAELVAAPEFGGRVAGVHVEGPFISPLPGAVGAHNPEWVRDPDPGILDELQEWARGTIRMLTLAPERNNAGALIRHAASMGITVSLGHCMATASDLAQAAAAGARSLTHLGNGIPNLLHRHHNSVWAGLANDDLSALMIADGHHLPDPVLKTMIRAKEVRRTVVISDASPLAGMPPGRYLTLGNLAVLEPSGLLHNPDKECLVGSSATLMGCMNHLASRGWLTLDELLAVGFYNPLRLIGLDPDAFSACARLLYDDETAEFRVST